MPRSLLPKLFGPVLLYDLIRLGRQSRYVLLRALFPVGLLLLLWFGYLSSHQGITPTHRTMAEFASSFFTAFVTVQMALCYLFTPVFTAGAIAEEKDRKRVDFLFATDLQNQEIVIGKLTARIANLGLLILAGLPVLSLMEFWGGLDPELLALCYAATGLSVVSLAALSILLSVFARRARDAILLVYLILIAYLGLSFVLYLVLSHPLMASKPIVSWLPTLTLGKLSRGFGAGNVLVARSLVLEGLAKGATIHAIVWRLFFRYVVFHALVTIASVTVAAWKVREKVLVELRPAQPTTKTIFPKGRLFDIGTRPLIWKELCIERGMSFNRAGRILGLLFVLSSFLPLVLMISGAIYEFVSYHMPVRYIWDSLGINVNVWVGIVGTSAACLTLLAIAVRAATSIPNEHERLTFESLASIPLPSRNILNAKWLGSIWSVRGGVAWLASVWFIGVLLGGLSPFTVPLLVLSWAVYAAFCASLGLACSVHLRATLPATVRVLLIAAIITIGHLLPWMIVGWPRLPQDYTRSYVLLERVYLLQLYGLAPPVAIGWLSFDGSSFKLLTNPYGTPWSVLESITEGLVLWAVASFLLWQYACRRLALERRGMTPSCAEERRKLLLPGRLKLLLIYQWILATTCLGYCAYVMIDLAFVRGFRVFNGIHLLILCVMLLLGALSLFMLINSLGMARKESRSLRLAVLGHFCFAAIALLGLFFCLLLSCFSPIGAEQVFFAYGAVVMALIINLSGWAYFYLRGLRLPPQKVVILSAHA